MPVVVVSGARQTGKSTMVSDLTTGRRRVTMDDLDAQSTARTHPEALLGGDQDVTIDEVQREPSLLSAIKREVDRKRVAGRFLVTGSANLLLMQGVSESLAGRASYLTLWPMTRREQLGLGEHGRWDRLYERDPSEWIAALDATTAPLEPWTELARRGGFPTPAVHLTSDADRTLWFEGYTRTYLERDLQDLSAISALPDFRRLMRATALRSGQLANQTELGRDVSLPQPTVHRYLNLLEASYLLVRVPAYSVNRTKRLIKTPKLYWCDTGLARYLAGDPDPTGASLENIILHDLLVWRDLQVHRPEVCYWRTSIGEEVDFVIDLNGRLLPIEVKTTTSPRLADAAHLHTFRAEYREQSLPGLLLHCGDRAEWLSGEVLAMPWWRVV
jgi:predicted AAA+ superfamily ATPase